MNWSPTIIIALLRRGAKRHNQLRREMGGISQKMLTQTLRALERDGLARRTLHATVPPRVEYALIPLGCELAGVLGELCKWAEAHTWEMISARARFAAPRR